MISIEVPSESRLPSASLVFCAWCWTSCRIGVRWAGDAGDAVTDRGRAIRAAERGVPASRSPILRDLTLRGVDAAGEELVEELSVVLVSEGVRVLAATPDDLRRPTLRYLSKGDAFTDC